VVTVSHRLSTIPAAAWVVVLDGGRVVEQGYRDDLLAIDGALRHLIGTGMPDSALERLSLAAAE
jgi:ABC-type multidrug transport system fused ATPase/permease subunit